MTEETGLQLNDKQLGVKYLKPSERQPGVVKVKVYERSFLGNKQFESVKKERNERVVHIDPEVIHRMATLGLSREMVAAYYGISKQKFNAICEEYPDIDECFLMGMSAGMVKAAMALERQVENDNLISTIFRLKVGGMIEADKRKDEPDDVQQKVHIYLPDNGRDDID